MYSFKRTGHCPTCNRDTQFVSHHEWLRDNYQCTKCGSIPRERALLAALDKHFPGWEKLQVHEGSPANRHIADKAAHYSASQYVPEKTLGQQVGAFRNENLEHLTFPDNTFDLFITLDVLEHVFDPRKAVQEMYRVVRPGGVVAFTAPVHKQLERTHQRAALKADGTIDHLLEPVYHGNPVGDGRSLVTWDYGRDYLSLLKSWTDGTVIHTNEVQPHYGIEGEFLDVFLMCKNLVKGRQMREDSVLARLYNPQGITTIFAKGLSFLRRRRIR